MKLLKKLKKNQIDKLQFKIISNLRVSITENFISKKCNIGVRVAATRLVFTPVSSSISYNLSYNLQTYFEILVKNNENILQC